MAVAALVAFLVIPKIGLSLGPSFAAFWVMVALGAVLGEWWHRRCRARSEQAWRRYQDEVRAVSDRALEEDDEVAVPALQAMRFLRQAESTVKPWPELAEALPDIPTLSARVIRARLEHLAGEAHEAREHREVEAILEGADVSRDDDALATVRARAGHLHDRAQGRQERVDEALDQLRRAQETAEHLMATARARTYVATHPRTSPDPASRT